jgi:hypothetical protein
MADSALTLTISCSTDPDLAEALYDYLRLNLHVNHETDIVLETDEIFVSSSQNAIVDKNSVIEAIRSFTESKHEYQNCQIMQFGDILTVGMPAKAGQLMENLLTCDMCNYLTPYQEQLWLHRMTHGNVMKG